MLQPAVDRLSSLLLSEPRSAGLFSDFDGTMAAIVADPAASAPVPGAMHALGSLAQHLNCVWLVSGRPVSFLQQFAPAGVKLSGLYGLESVGTEGAAQHPEAERWREVIHQVAKRAESSLPGVLVEPKGLALTLHFRSDDELAHRVQEFAKDSGERTGLVTHDARKSIELRPPIQADKGTVIEAAGEGLKAACFFGDDRGDLTAFDALDRMAAQGVATLRCGVNSPEAPAELIERADLVFDGPAEVVEVLTVLTTKVAA